MPKLPPSEVYGQRSAPFTIDLTKYMISIPPPIITNSELPQSRPLQSHTCPYDILFAAAYRTEHDDIAAPHTGLDYLHRELSVRRLNKIHKWLWTVGRPMPPRPLHHQRLLGREIVLTERMDMHLIWSDSRMFLKPLPRFLLSPQFWRDYLICYDKCSCSRSNAAQPETSHMETECEQSQLRKCALGFLLSYAALVSYESDFVLAQETHLLSTDIPWLAWKAFIKQILEDEFIYRHINKRFLYGELRLSRLNKIYRLTGISMRGYQLEYFQYSSFFQENFTWLASLLAYMVIVLTAMQVGLGTSVLQENNAFQAASYGFTVFTIVASLAAVVLIFALFLAFFVFNWIRTLGYRRKRFGWLRQYSGDAVEL